MHSSYRRLIPFVVALLLLTPVAVFAQTETAAQLVELVFSDDESSVSIEENYRKCCGGYVHARWPKVRDESPYFH